MKSPTKSKVYKEDLKSRPVDPSTIDGTIKIYDQLYDSEDSNKGIQDKSGDGSGGKVPGLMQIKKTPARESRRKGNSSDNAQ